VRPAIRASLVIVVATCAGLVLSAPGLGAAKTTRDVAFGVADDAWLTHGPGTLASRLDELASLGPDVVRYTVHWDQVARKRPRNPRDPDDPAYRWGEIDAILRGLRRHGIAPVVTLYGTPSWANGGRAANWVPSSGKAFADFAYAAGRRYSWIRDWTIWNEPNRTAFLRPTDAKTSQQGELADLSRWTGGDLRYASLPSHLVEAVRDILTELRFQYLITFEPGARPGWHPIEIRTRKRDLTVHARGGYMSGPLRSGSE